MSKQAELTNEFGVEIKDFLDEAIALKAELDKAPQTENVATTTTTTTKEHKTNKEIAKDASTNIRLHPKEPKSKKVKFANVARYILTELAQFDNEFEEANFELVTQEHLNEGDENLIARLEAQLEKIEGAVDALHQMGRYFGMSNDMLLKYIPNITEDWNDRHEGIDTTLKAISQ